jgi:hypothetical protein
MLPDLPAEQFMEFVRPAVKEKPAAERPKPKPEKRAPGIIVPSDDVPVADDSDPVLPDDEGDGPTMDTDDRDTSDDAAAGNTGIPMPMPAFQIEQRPHFRECMSARDSDLCTEERIHRHLQRHLRTGPLVKGSLSTTVTFEVDAEGQVGRIHCAPKVPAEVEREIQRVLRTMPEFIPGSQGGMPVAVWYQIPLRLSSR